MLIHKEFLPCSRLQLTKCPVQPHRGASLNRIMISAGVGGIAIYRFESFHPSHTVLLFGRVGRLCGKLPTFGALASPDSVSGAY
jgi:hypothetical protein